MEHSDQQVDQQVYCFVAKFVLSARRKRTPHLLEGYQIPDDETAYFTVTTLQMVLATNVNIVKI